MKKNINKVVLFIVIVLSLIFVSTQNIYASTNQNLYVNINDTQNLDVGSLAFTNISFKDLSSNSTKAFGLTGLVKNNSNNDINYNSISYYYDSDYNLIAQGDSSGTAIAGTSDFNQMSNLSILGNHNINEIAYYRLSVTISDSNLSKTNSTNVSRSNNYLYNIYEYIIEKYDVNMVVNENNTFDITETITAYFNNPKHGIIRNIPLKNTITRLDGTTSSNRTQITNLSVNSKYISYKEGNDYKIKIGDENHTLIGRQTFVIKYTYNLGKDPMEDYDELYYNIIGNEWDTVINNITFSIKMPKEFDSSKLGFSSGKKGSTNNNQVKYNVIGNTITGSYDDILDVREALTVRCELPEGYFVGAKLYFNPLNYSLLLLPFIFVIISILLWYKFGRDNKVIETVEFYPPEGFNSLEVGFLYKGRADNKDVASLLIYLANKGYIKITETKKKSLFSKSKGFKITKLKEYDGNNINEKRFLIGLFKKNPKFDPKFNKKEDLDILFNANETTSDYLYNNFYTTMDTILHNINSKENKSKIFEKSASGKIIYIMAMIIVTYCLITIPPIFVYGQIKNLSVLLLFSIIGFVVLFALVLGKLQINTLGNKIFMLVWILGFVGLPWAGIALPALIQDSFYLKAYGFGFACIFAMFIFLNKLPKRTPYGNQMLGKLRGFKNFLETAEKEKLEAMVTQDPAYFYNILPYTYVLNVSDKWIKKFELLSLQAPSWYDSPDPFDMDSFNSFMDSAMSSATNAMSSNSSSGSGSSGSSSGGGSSGGGSGGGGGSSW